MSPQQLNNLLQQLKSEFVEINSAWVVIDDSQLIKGLAEKVHEDNMFLVGVLPSYGTSGNSPDAYKDTAVSQIMILEKTGYSELEDNDLIDLFERTYQVAKRVKESIIAKSTEDCNSLLFNLEINSLAMDPVWKKAECNGWSLDLQIS